MTIAEKIVSLPEEKLTPDEAKLKDLAVDRVISMVLEKKYGIPGKLLIFQEDIMALCSYGANFSLALADDVRRAMGKKNMDLMLQFKEAFIKGWEENVGIFAEEVWLKMVDYAKYCFNKSHAVAYTLVSLKTDELQTYNFDDYTKWNYLNLKQEMKEKAVEVARGRGYALVFPTHKNPFGGMELGNIKFQGLDEPEEEIAFDTVSDLFLANIDVTVKSRMILRGIYDVWTKDILGLVKLNKRLGKNALKGAQFPGTNSFKDFMSMLKMKGLIDYIDTGETYVVAASGKVDLHKEKLTEKEYFTIAKSLASMTSVARNYRVKSILKEFGTYKVSDLSPFPDDLAERTSIIVEKYANVFDRVRAVNPDLKITNYNMDKVMKMAKKIYEVFVNNVSSYGSYVGYVRSIDVQKTGKCKIDVVFNGTSKVFYTSDPDIKVGISKNDIVAFKIWPAHYVGRDGYLKFVWNIALDEF